MSIQAPHEIIAQPFILWLAPVAEPFPEIDADVEGNWAKVGTSGDLNYTEDGVVLTHAQTVEAWRALGSTGPRKAFRTEEELRIAMTLADLTLEAYALALNHNTVTPVDADVDTGGYKKLGLSRGLDLPQRALLVRGVGSPYGPGTAQSWNMQYEVPIAVQVSEPEVVFVKGEPAALALEWMALEDPSASSVDERFGRLLAQNADEGT